MADIHTLILKSDSTQIKQSSRDLDGLTTSAKKADGSTDKLGKTSKDTNDSFLGLNAATMALTASVYALTKGANLAVNSFIDIENAQIGVKKTTGLAAAEFEKLNTEIEKMATTKAGFAVAGLYDIAEAAGQLGIQGVEDIAEFTRVIAMVGLTTELTAQESGVAFAKLSKQLQEPIANTERLASVFNELSNTTAATVGDLLTFSSRIAGAGKTVGLTTAEIAGLSATLTDLGVNYEVGGSAISRTLMLMASDSKKFAKAMGEDAEEFSSLVENEPTQALEKLLDTMSTLSASDSINLLKKIGLGGVETAGVLLKVASSTDTLTKNLAIANKEYLLGTSMQLEYETASERLQAQNTKLSASLKLLGSDIGEFFKEPILEASSFLTDLSEGTRTLITDISTMYNALENLKIIKALESETKELEDLEKTMLRIVNNDSYIGKQLKLAFGLEDTVEGLTSEISEQEAAIKILADRYNFLNKPLEENTKLVGDSDAHVVAYYKHLKELKDAKDKEAEADKKTLTWLTLTNNARNEAAEALRKYNAELLAVDNEAEATWNASENDDIVASIRAENAERERTIQLNKEWIQDLQEFYAFDPEFDDEGKNFFEGWDNTLSNTVVDGIQDALNGDFDFESITSSLSSSLGNAMATQSMTSMMGTAGVTSGNLYAMAGGVAMMGLSSLMGGSSKSASQQAEDYFNKFMDGLDEATEALENFGNVGSATALKIESFEAEKANIETQQSFTSGNGLLDMITPLFDEMIEDIDEGLANVISTSLSDSLDFATLSTQQLSDLTKDVDVTKMEALDVELNNLALSMKLLGDETKWTAEQQAEADKIAIDTREILLNTEYQYYKNVEEAIDIMDKANEAIADENKELQERYDLLLLTNDAEATLAYNRELELKTIDEANKALLESIYLEEDRLVALEEANAAQEAAIEATNAILDERLSLEERLLELTGSEIENLTYTRTKELSAVDDVNKALLESIYAEEDRQKAIEDANAAQIDGLEAESDALNDFLNTLADDVNTVESSLDSLNGIIDKLSAATLGSTYTLDNFYASMAESIELSKQNDFEAFNESLQKTIDYSEALFDPTAFQTSRDQEFAQLVALNQFGDLESTMETELDVLKQIEINTKSSADSLELQIQGLTGSITSLSEATTAASVASSTAPVSILATDPTITAESPSLLEAITPPNYEQLAEQAFQDVLHRGTATESGLALWASQAETLSDFDLRKSIAEGALFYSGALPSSMTWQELLQDRYDALAWLQTNGVNNVAMPRATQLTEAELEGMGKDAMFEYGNMYGFAVGTPSVPYDMTANIHRGEMIVPETFNQGIQSGKITIGENKEMNSRLDALISEVAALRADNNYYNKRLDDNTRPSRIA